MSYEKRCKVCTHKDADLINDLLRRRALGESVTYDMIIAAVEERGGELSITSLSRHASRHFDVGEEGRRRAAAAYDKAADAVAGKKLSDVEILDSVIEMAHKRMLDGEVNPDIRDLISAQKVKHGVLMKEENPLGALLEAVSACASPLAEGD